MQQIFWRAMEVVKTALGRAVKKPAHRPLNLTKKVSPSDGSCPR
jgi:hypothetical protein